MPRKEYLSQEARFKFDNPPVLNAEQRKIFLQAPAWAMEYLKNLLSPSNKVGFLLQVGYFRIVSRFFVSSRFHQADVDFIAHRISVDSNSVDITEYENRTALRHQKDVLQYFGFSPFNKVSADALTEEAHRFAHVQTRPHLIFSAMVGFLQEHHTEIPTYHTLKIILDKALDRFEHHLESILTRHLNPEDVKLLDQLLTEHSSYQENDRDHLKVKRYEITFLKKISQPTETRHIRERVRNFEYLKKLYIQLLPVTRRLKLSDTVIQFYAEYVINRQIHQIANRNTSRYLLLIAFIIHRYYSFGDALILTLNSAVSNYLNGCVNRIKEETYQNRVSTAQLVSNVAYRNVTHLEVLTSIEKIIADTSMPPAEKVAGIDALLKKKRLSQKLLQEDQARLNSLKQANQRINDSEDYYQALERNSSRLTAKVGDILKTIVVNPGSSGKEVLSALLYFQDKKGTIAHRSTVPIDFLQMEERQRVLTEEGKLRIGLYKVFLFQQVRDAIKSGTLAIDSTYEYRAFEEYEIPLNVWQKDKEKLIEQSGLTDFRHARPSLLKLNDQLNAQIKMTNERIICGENKQVSFDASGGWHLMKDKREEEENENTESLYPQDYVIPLLEVLSTIDDATDFVSAFEYHGLNYLPKRPDRNLFFAAMIGYGCNIGIRKFASISKGISTNTLETTALHYFSPETLIRVNDKILTFSNSLPLTAHFRKDPEFLHTSSDGQKFDVSVASLVASPSFKYFGNGRGVTFYSFMDESGQLFYSTAFSSADPESHYLIDGLTYNEVIRPDAHSTDTHGVSEAVFAITGLFRIESRPRFARFHHQQLYSIDEVRTYREQGYKIIPDQKINLEHLEGQWDEILRMACTIKLGYAKASTLFRRLNSYSKQHPLYRALRDLGRLFKTKYIYQYMDDLNIRQSVSRALSRIESSNNFSKAITFGNNQQLIWATRREQQTAEGSKRGIANAINAYNSLILSEKLVQTRSEVEKQKPVGKD